MLIRKFFFVMSLLATVLAPAPGRAAPLYNLSVLPGATGFYPTDLNNSGQLAGYIGAGGGYTHAAIHANGVVTDLGMVGGYNSQARAINDAGAVTGWFVDGTAQHAFRYQAGSTLDIGAGTSGSGINAQGDVVGAAFTSDGYMGFVYRDGSVTQLGNLGTGLTGIAFDINDHGNIVGDSIIDAAPAHSPLHPFFYSDGTLIDLGTLADQELNGAIGINNAGQIAGYSTVASQDWHVFLYEDGVMQDLGNFGGRDLNVNDFNEHGTVVGTGRDPFGTFVPFRSTGAGLVDLNTLIDPALGWHLDYAYANNDLEQIIASGCQGEVCGLVRLDPAAAVPEPQAVLLLCAGLLVLLMARHRPGSSRQVPWLLQMR